MVRRVRLSTAPRHLVEYPVCPLVQHLVPLGSHILDLARPMSNENTQKLIKQIKEVIEDPYAELVRSKHPATAAQWPVISGRNLLVGQ